MKIQERLRFIKDLDGNELTVGVVLPLINVSKYFSFNENEQNNIFALLAEKNFDENSKIFAHIENQILYLYDSQSQMKLTVIQAKKSFLKKIEEVYENYLIKK